MSQGGLLVTFDSSKGNAAHKVLLHQEEGERNGTDCQNGDGHLCRERRNLDAKCLRARLQDGNIGRNLVEQVLQRQQLGIIDKEQREIPVIPEHQRAE